MHALILFHSHDRCELLELEEGGGVSICDQITDVQCCVPPPPHHWQFRSWGEGEVGEQDDVKCAPNPVRFLCIKLHVYNEDRDFMIDVGVLVSQIACFFHACTRSLFLASLYPWRCWRSYSRSWWVPPVGLCCRVGRGIVMGTGRCWLCPQPFSVPLYKTPGL